MPRTLQLFFVSWDSWKFALEKNLMNIHNVVKYSFLAIALHVRTHVIDNPYIHIM